MVASQYFGVFTNVNFADTPHYRTKSSARCCIFVGKGSKIKVRRQ